MEQNNEKGLPVVAATEAVGNTEYIQKIFENIRTRFPEELDHAQGRTNFQIEKFITLTEHTISAKYKHCLKNAAIMRSELFRTIKEGLEAQRTFDYRWKDKDQNEPITIKDRQGNERLCWYDLDLMAHQLMLNDLAIGIKDKVQQLETFDAILDALIEQNGGPITKEQFDAEEPLYWERRFMKQIYDDSVSRVTGINPGNLESLRYAAAAPVVPGSMNQIDIENIPDVTKLLENPGEYLNKMKAIFEKGLTEADGNKLLSGSGSIQGQLPTTSK